MQQVNGIQFSQSGLIQTKEEAKKLLNEVKAKMQENGITIASIDLAQDQTEGRKLNEIMAYLEGLGQISEPRFIQLVLMLNLAETLKMELT